LPSSLLLKTASERCDAQARTPLGRRDGGASPAPSAGDSTSRAPGSAASAAGSPAAARPALGPPPSLDQVQRGRFVVLCAPAPGAHADAGPGDGGADAALAFAVAGTPLWLAKVVAAAGEGAGTDGPGPAPAAAAPGPKLHLFARAPGARHFSPAVDARGYPLLHPTAAARPLGAGELLAVFDGLDHGRRGGGGRLPRAVAAELAARLQGRSPGARRLSSTEEGGSATSDSDGA